jgi:signal transduction histidine kinase
VLIDGIRVSGLARSLSAAGETELDGIVLAPDQRDVAIDYVGLPRALAGALQFQYRLAAGEPWSPSSANRSLILGGLAPGVYRIEIRALDPAGRPSPDTAIVSMRVLTPFYLRAWFIVTVSLSALALAMAAYRARIGRLVALERQRTRIAMDLHDEMGSRLGSIGLLADLAREDSLVQADRRQLLDQVAETAADMGSSLTDIVWSLRPGEITTAGLARHLIDHARRTFPGRQPSLDIRVPDDAVSVQMSLAARRNVFLIGLEALHNAARHSGATAVVLELRPHRRWWRLVVADDGRGIDVRREGREAGGFGFETMTRRASEIGAALEMESRPGGGTSIRLHFDPRAEGRSWPSHMNIRWIRARIRGISWGR